MLEELITERKAALERMDPFVRFLKQRWDLADADGSNTLDRGEVKDLLKELNINSNGPNVSPFLPTAAAAPALLLLVLHLARPKLPLTCFQQTDAIFNRYDVDNSNELDFMEFAAMVKLLKFRPEVAQIWESLGGEPVSQDDDPGEPSSSPSLTNRRFLAECEIMWRSPHDASLGRCCRGRGGCYQTVSNLAYQSKYSRSFS